MFDFSDPGKVSKVTTRGNIYLMPGAIIKINYDGDWLEQLGRNFLLFGTEPGSNLYDYGADIFSIDGLWRIGCQVYRSHADNYFYIVESMTMTRWP